MKKDYFWLFFWFMADVLLMVSAVSSLYLLTGVVWWKATIGVYVLVTLFRFSEMCRKAWEEQK